MLRASIAGLVTLLALLLLAACGNKQDRSVASRTPSTQVLQPAPAPVGPALAAVPEGAVRVGLLLPKTGQQGTLGQALANAANMAYFDIGADVNLIQEDTQSTPEGAAKAAQALLAQGVQIILGPVFGADAQRIAPMARAAGVPIITFSTDRTVAGPGVYVMGILPTLQVQRIVNYAARQDLRQIGALVPANAYGQAVLSGLQEAAARAGVDVGATTTYDPAADDKAFYASELAAAGYQAVLVPEGGESLKAMAPALFGSTQLLGTTLWDDPALAGLPYLEGAWFAAPPPDRRTGFEQKYVSLHGSTPPRLATIVYDAVALAAALAKRGQGFGQAALTQPGGFSGLDGIFRFRPDGTVERGLAVMEFRGGRIAVREPAAGSFDDIIF